MTASTFDVNRFKKAEITNDQYEKQLRRLVESNKVVDCIEKAVRDSLLNIAEHERRSFIIYGEPQSGKTEMMICLTAKLLDSGRPFIIHLLNDSVDLLGQNLGRFQESGLAPSAHNYTDILDPSIDVSSGRHVIFCKKNAGDLRKLLDKIGQVDRVVIIDDEADYASPNSKINQAEKTRVNELIDHLLGKTGDYIGVTATPARLNLNNTFSNDSSLWVNFPPHGAYTGQDVFFPIEVPTNPLDPKFIRSLIPDNHDDPKYARQALFSFFVNVAYLNKYFNLKEENYSFLVHTSGKRADHRTDWGIMQATLAALIDRTREKFNRYAEDIWKLAKARYVDADADALTSYILDNASRNRIVVLNSDRDFKQNGTSATKPSSLFTIIIGGNIVSRGVTFDNLLSMFFTRDVTHKIQQDTYIQRARMFGSRERYLRFFELTIPRNLYSDWHRCFVFHRLALEAIKHGNGSPVWLSNSRISAVASSSIDRSTVDIDRGEMSFQIFDLPDNVDDEISRLNSISSKLDRLSDILPPGAFPQYLRQFLNRTSHSIERAVQILPSYSITNLKDAEGLDKDKIERRRGFLGKSQIGTDPNILHHMRIIFNENGKARLFYKFSGSIQFIKNMR